MLLLHQVSMPGRLALFAALALFMALALAACGGGDEPTAEPTKAPGNTPEPTATTAPGTAPAATPTAAAEAFSFEGKTIRITVGYAPGGGFDTYARILAVHMQENLTGNPQVIVSNLPGADSLVAARQVANTQPRGNEVEIVNFISTLGLNMTLGNVEGLTVDNFTFIGSPDSQPGDQVLCGRAAVVSSLEEMLSSGRTYTASGLGGISNYDINLKAAKAMGLPIEIVYGYGGTSEMIAAFNRGEVATTPSCRDADVQNNPHWLAEDYIVPLLVFDAVPDWLKEEQAAGRFQNVGDVLEFNPDADPDVKRAVAANQKLGRSTRIYAVHPDTDPAIVQALRAGMEQIVNSEAFAADMEARGYTAGFLAGEEYQAALDEVLNMPPAALEALKSLLQPV